MNPNSGQPPTDNWRQKLAACVDGELDADACRYLVDWFRQHPEYKDCFAAQRDLSPANASFWSEVRPPEPTATSWNRIQDAIRAAVEAIPPEPCRSSRRRRYWWASVLLIPATVAAAVLLAVSFGNLDRSAPMAPAPPDSGTQESVFAVLTPADVSIHSVRTADVPLLVVGESPLRGGVTLATYTEVKFDSVQPDWDGMMPVVQTGNEMNSPMVYSLLTRVP